MGVRQWSDDVSAYCTRFTLHVFVPTQSSECINISACVDEMNYHMWTRAQEKLVKMPLLHIDREPEREGSKYCSGYLLTAWRKDERRQDQIFFTVALHHNPQLLTIESAFEEVIIHLVMRANLTLYRDIFLASPLITFQHLPLGT